jgi:hypothetical protein
MTQWAADRTEQLNQLSEMVQNNAMTQSIMGYNEVQTSVQTDISDVLGTVNSLFNAGDSRIFQDLRSNAGGVYGMFNSGKGWLSGFEGMFDNLTDGFQNFSLASIGNPDANIDQITNAGGLEGFRNQIGGTRAALNTAFLQESRNREERLDQWSGQDYGDNVTQYLGTTNTLLAENLRHQYRQAEMQALKENEDYFTAAIIKKEMNARAGRANIRTKNAVLKQLKY